MKDDALKFQIEYGKLAMLAVVILGGFTIIGIGMLTFAADDPRFAPVLALGSAQIAGAVGYLTGNGRLATKGEPNVPAIGAPAARLAATALATGELVTVPTGELLERRAQLRQAEQTGAVLQGLAAITLELERRRDNP